MLDFEVWEQKLCPRIQGLFLSRVLAQISKRDQNRWELPIAAASFPDSGDPRPEEWKTQQQIPDNWLALLWKKLEAQDSRGGGGRGKASDLTCL